MTSSPDSTTSTTVDPLQFPTSLSDDDDVSVSSSIAGRSSLLNKSLETVAAPPIDANDCSIVEPSIRNFCSALPDTPSCGALSMMQDMKDSRDELLYKLKLSNPDEAAAADDTATTLLSSLFACATPDDLQDSESESQPVPASILADPTRTIAVVTTAAMPWRTGTAVNPLLRALYLVRFQEEERRKAELKLLETSNANAATTSTDDSNVNTNATTSTTTTSTTTAATTKKQGQVALVIPWLESPSERTKLYGPTLTFPNGPPGMKEQSDWIRSYASTRCGMKHEAHLLKIIWYPAFYVAGFGSIFPKVDLCNFIPKELVDVAILEEPEHLNWFRMPNAEFDHDDEDDSGREEEGEGRNNTTISEESIRDDDKSALVGVISREDSSSSSQQQKQLTTTGNATNNKRNKPSLEKAKLGWTHRFQFVVGIVHTNYEAYARQYGIGASLIAAPTIGAVSALAIRAYCHQVIKLSDTLPSFAPGKECTCNVHGVRKEFLEGGIVDYKALAEEEAANETTAKEAPAAVYFIGKLVWAKGFDLMLEVQDIFKKKNGDYFEIDVYGGGPDEKSIVRAFHGRNHSSPAKRPVKKETLTPSPSEATLNDPKDLNAAAVFAHPHSIKDQTSEVIEQMKNLRTSRHDDDVVAQYLSLGFEVSGSKMVTYVKENRKDEEQQQQSNKDPLNIIGDLSVKSVDTGVAVSNAVYNIADSSIKNILAMSFSQLKSPLSSNDLKELEKAQTESGGGQEETKEKKHLPHFRNPFAKDKNSESGDTTDDSAKGGQKEKTKFVFDPPQSRWELRRHPVPAKFPGVIDHAQLISVPHKIFLNPSTSEVLCTTSAEALAMGKFVILPKHPSNEFFLQFTNCLAYETLEECAEKMKWALERDPTPLSEEERHKFTWEAATDRLMASSLVTVREARERATNGMDKTDARIAFWLSESGEKGSMIRNLFSKKGEASSHPTPNWSDYQDQEAM